jgi:hypothetical protein
VLQHHDLLPVTWKQVDAEDFTAPVAQVLLRAIAEAPAGDLDAVLERLPDEDSRARVRALAMSETTVEPDPSHVAELVARLRAATVQRQIDAVREELAAVNASTDPARNRSLLERHGVLEQRKRELLEHRGD